MFNSYNVEVGIDFFMQHVDLQVAYESLDHASLLVNSIQLNDALFSVNY